MAAGAAPFAEPALDTELARSRRILSGLLSVGLWVSVALLSVGVLLHVLSGAREAPALHLATLGQGAGLVGRAETTLALGVLTLAITPVLRVISLAILFATERDWPFFRRTVVVLVLLAFGLALGKGG